METKYDDLVKSLKTVTPAPCQARDKLQQEFRTIWIYWISASAGMTKMEKIRLVTRPSKMFLFVIRWNSLLN